MRLPKSLSCRDEDVTSQLSIVFQGPVCIDGEVSKKVLQNIHRVRKLFPDAECIVSTWYIKSEVDKRLKEMLTEMGVILVQSVDPGPLTVKNDSGVHVVNINRLLLSSKVGLAVATRPLALKLRTDSYLTGRQIIQLLKRFVLQDAGPVRNPAYKIFRARVINASWFARDARGTLPYLYHPGDIFLAGYSEDVRLFFSAPLADENLFMPASPPGLWCAWRYVPEQWCWVHAIKSVTDQIVYAGNFSFSPNDMTSSEQYYLANFIPFRPFQLGLRWPKYWTHYPFRGLFSTVTPRRWRFLIQIYECGKPNTSYPLPDRVAITLWRLGYRLRAKLLNKAVVSRLLLRLFGRRA